MRDCEQKAQAEAAELKRRIRILEARRVQQSAAPPVPAPAPAPAPAPDTRLADKVAMPGCGSGFPRPTARTLISQERQHWEECKRLQARYPPSPLAPVLACCNPNRQD